MASKKHTNGKSIVIQSLTCDTYNSASIGHVGRMISIRYKEHKNYIKINNPQSANAINILNIIHECGTQEGTMQIFKAFKKWQTHESLGGNIYPRIL